MSLFSLQCEFNWNSMIWNTSLSVSFYPVFTHYWSRSGRPLGVRGSTQFCLLVLLRPVFPESGWRCQFTPSELRHSGALSYMLTTACSHASTDNANMFRRYGVQHVICFWLIFKGGSLMFAFNREVYPRVQHWSHCSFSINDLSLICCNSV